MGTIHDAGEWLRLAEHYRRMTDGELIAIAGDRTKLTEIAQQILAMELSARRLKVELEKASRKLEEAESEKRGASRRLLDHDDVHRDTGESSYAGDPYAADRELVEICTVWSLSDALQLERMLNSAGIPFFMGAEKATSVDSVTSNFPSGVSVQVMRIGAPWARQALEHYEAKDVPESEKQQWLEKVDVRCPSCRSTDIVFEEMVPSGNNSSAKYKWTCGVCGHEWEDDGLAI